MNFTKQLVQIGLTESEAMVYQEVLRQVTVKPANLARRVNLSRPAVYDVLQNLKNKGLIYETKEKTTRTFAAKDPRALEDFIDEVENQAKSIAEKRRQQLNETLAGLLDFSKNATLSPRLFFFEGEQGIWTALQETLKTKDIIRAYANIGTITDTMGEKFDLYLKERIKKNIFARAIVSDTKEWRKRVQKSREELRDVRFMTSGDEYTPEINIFDNNILMISWKENFAIIIRSKDFADAQKVIFDELWSKLS